MDRIFSCCSFRRFNCLFEYFNRRDHVLQDINSYDVVSIRWMMQEIKSNGATNENWPQGNLNEEKYFNVQFRSLNSPVFDVFLSANASFEGNRIVIALLRPTIQAIIQFLISQFLV